MRVWTHDRFLFPLPERHKFPLGKYARLRERLVAEGVVDEVLESEPASWEALGRVHDAALLERIRTVGSASVSSADSDCPGRPSSSSAAADRRGARSRSPARR